jgi:hypothetical protein
MWASTCIDPHIHPRIAIERKELRHPASALFIGLFIGHAKMDLNRERIMNGR